MLEYENYQDAIIRSYGGTKAEKPDEDEETALDGDTETVDGDTEAADGDAATDGDADTEDETAVDATGGTCLDIAQCVKQCSQPICLERCAETGNAAAQQTWAEYNECLDGHNPSGTRCRDITDTEARTLPRLERRNTSTPPRQPPRSS